MAEIDAHRVEGFGHRNLGLRFRNLLFGVWYTPGKPKHTPKFRKLPYIIIIKVILVITILKVMMIIIVMHSNNHNVKPHAT